MHILYVNIFVNGLVKTSLTFKVERVGTFSGQLVVAEESVCFYSEQTPSNVDQGSFYNCLVYFQKILRITSWSNLTIQLVLRSTHIQHIHVFAFCFWPNFICLSIIKCAIRFCFCFDWAQMNYYDYLLHQQTKVQEFLMVRAKICSLNKVPVRIIYEDVPPQCGMLVSVYALMSQL